MDIATEALTPKFTLPGFILAIVGGAIAAGATGFAYHLIANKVGVDYIIALAAVLGLVVGSVVGLAARIGRMRAAMTVAVIGFVFGVAGYAARYIFEFNEFVDSAAQEVGASREDLLAFLAEVYPPGGVAGYLQIVAEEGFSIGSRGSSNSDAPIKGGLAWGLLGVEALVAGLVAGATARRAVLKSIAPATPPAMPAA